MTHACTIVARNYLAHARVLTDSFLAHHEGGRVTVLVLDPDFVTGEERFRALDVYSIGIDRAEVHRMAAIYDVTEFATAVKPFLLQVLLVDDEPVVYLDPDIEVLEPLDDIFQLARDRGIVVTPHTLEPLARDGREPSETTILRVGVYNLGFIAVGPAAQPFLAWWSERLARECVVDLDGGRFVDQRWVDLALALFDVHILRDPGCNVAWWNLANRRIERGASGYTVEGEPLRFFHFSGFSPGAPDLLSKYLPAPRVSVQSEPGLRDLLLEYRQQLLEAGYESLSSVPYTWDTASSGAALDRSFRIAYRSTLEHAERTGEALPPDPFDAASSKAFARWCAHPPPEAAAPPLSRVARLLEHGPGGGFLGGDAGRPTNVARRLARRLLWPFLTREQSLHRAYAELLGEHERRLARLEAREDELCRLESLIRVETHRASR